MPILNEAKTPKINEGCRDLAKLYGKAEPKVTSEGMCSLCGSVLLTQLIRYLEDGGDGRWLEPIQGTFVTHFLCNDGHRFNLRHLYDENVDDEARDAAMGLMENHAGNLELFVRELSKYYEE